MRRIRWTVISIFAIATINFISCSKDKVDMVDLICEEDVTYTDQVVSIINVSCAYAGCHVQGFPSGDYTTYESMLPQLNDQQFVSRVINLRDMPPKFATGPSTLSAADINILRCWIRDGYPKGN